MISLTIDANRINARGKLPGMITLEHWQQAGHVRFIGADRLRHESSYSGHARAKTRIRQPVGEPFILDVSFLDSDAYFADERTPDFTTVASVVFPKKVRNLDEQSMNDVMHLLAHEAAGGDIFVTADGAILQAAEQLKLHFGTVVMTDDEAVVHLRGLYGWP